MCRWARLVVALVLVVTVAACDDDETDETTVTTAAVTTTIPTTANLQAMLLTADDIENTTGATDRWTVFPVEDEFLRMTVGAASCEDTTLDPEIAERLRADVGIEALPDSGLANIWEGLVTGDPEQFNEDLDGYRDAVESCFTTQGDVTFQQLALPELGDPQWALVWTTVPKTPVPQCRRGYQAWVGVGTAAVYLTWCDEPAPADEEFVQLLETAVAKING